MAAGKKTGGRKRGSKNKATIELEEAIADSGEMPKGYMLRVMRDPKAEPARRDAMAKAVAPYCHPHLASIQHSGEMTVRHEDALEQLDGPATGNTPEAAG